MNEQKYCIKAKRKNTKEKWSEWTTVCNYEDAVRHANHVEELGYSSKIIVKEEGADNEQREADN